jgi:DNA-directed RNA polymerase subunit RPC12/RpoP
MQCPKCSANLPIAKIILKGIEDLKCPGCSSRLVISGVRNAEMALAVISTFAFFYGSWMAFALGLMFLLGAFVVLINMLVRVSVVEAP